MRASVKSAAWYAMHIFDPLTESINAFSFFDIDFVCSEIDQQCIDLIDLKVLLSPRLLLKCLQVPESVVFIVTITITIIIILLNCFKFQRALLFWWLPCFLSSLSSHWKTLEFQRASFISSSYPHWSLILKTIWDQNKGKGKYFLIKAKEFWIETRREQNEQKLNLLSKNGSDRNGLTGGSELKTNTGQNNSRGSKSIAL